MKFLTKYIVFLFLIILYACGEPSPTELKVTGNTGNDQLTVEAVSPNPDVYVYSNGYDSTGILNTIPKYFNVISVSVIKNKIGRIVNTRGYASATFFDKSKPVIRSGKLLGYKTKAVGTVKFDDDSAKIVHYHLKFMYHRQIREVTLGPQYLLYKRMGNMMFNPSDLFNSKVKFTLIPYQNRNKQYVTNIVMPPQLNSEIFLSGSHSKNNLHIQIIWNSDVGREIEIIIGGMHKGKMSVFPLIKLKAPDNGKLMLPNRIIKLIPFKKFDKIVFSLIRRNEIILTNIYNLGKTYFTSQSINNTIINVK